MGDSSPKLQVRAGVLSAAQEPCRTSRRLPEFSYVGVIPTDNNISSLSQPIQHTINVADQALVRY